MGLFYVCDCLKRHVFLVSWISLIVYLFHSTFIFYNDGKQFFYLRNILGLGLCFSRATAAVLNLSSSMILLPSCKKMNQIVFKIFSKIYPDLFFYWLEKSKSFHMTVAATLVVFSVIHSISHFINLWNFSRNYDEDRLEINMAKYKNENPIYLLRNPAAFTGVFMLLILLSMGFSSLRVVRRKFYNIFWYTHKLYLPFIILLIFHPISGVLKEEVLDVQYRVPGNDNQTNETVLYFSGKPKFVPIKSYTWLWLVLPFSCYFLDIIWRILSRNRNSANILRVVHMAGGTMNLTMQVPFEEFSVRMGQYVLMQCLEISLLEWHPFTVVQVPTKCTKEFSVWIRVKGDWTEEFERLIVDEGPHKLRILVDGPFASPMEGVSQSYIAICVAAGVGITPFTTLMQEMLIYPRKKTPERVHLIWIIRSEEEITWIAYLLNKLLTELRNANKPDRLHIEFYVTSANKTFSTNEIDLSNHINRVAYVNEKGETNILNKDIISDEKITLLTPIISKKLVTKTSKITNTSSKISICKQYPLLGCRIKRGRPYWDRLFGNWVNLYPGTQLDVYCCGPKNLTKVLYSKCQAYSRTTKTKFKFIHEGFT